jgi:hypothetical protein
MLAPFLSAPSLSVTVFKPAQIMLVRNPAALIRCIFSRTACTVHICRIGATTCNEIGADYTKGASIALLIHAMFPDARTLYCKRERHPTKPLGSAHSIAASLNNVIIDDVKALITVATTRFVAIRGVRLSRISVVGFATPITTLAFTQAIQTLEAVMITGTGGIQGSSTLGRGIGSEMVSASIVQTLNVWHPIAPTYRSTLKSSVKIMVTFKSYWTTPDLVSLSSQRLARSFHRAECPTVSHIPPTQRVRHP